MFGRSIGAATNTVVEFDAANGVTYFALLLRLGGGDAVTARETYDHLLMALWVFVANRPLSEHDTADMREFANAWCLQRYSPT